MNRGYAEGRISAGLAPGRRGLDLMLLPRFPDFGRSILESRVRFAAAARWRHLNRHDIQPVLKVLAEIACGDKRVLNRDEWLTLLSHLSGWAGWRIQNVRCGVAWHPQKVPFRDRRVPTQLKSSASTSFKDSPAR